MSIKLVVAACRGGIEKEAGRFYCVLRQAWTPASVTRDQHNRRIYRRTEVVPTLSTLPIAADDPQWPSACATNWALSWISTLP